MADAKRPEVIAGPDPATAVAKSRPLVARVYAPNHMPDPKIAMFRLRKALTSPRDIPDDELRPLVAACSPEERREVLEDIAKGAALPADESTMPGAKKPGWTAAYRLRQFWDWRNGPFPEPAQAQAPTTFTPPRRMDNPGDGGGFDHDLEIGALVHFTLDGETHTGKVLSWGKRGARVIIADGRTASVVFGDLKQGVAPGAEREYAEKQARRALAKSVGLRAMLEDADVEQRDRILRSMGAA